jgi:hypothetical protein
VPAVLDDGIEGIQPLLRFQRIEIERFFGVASHGDLLWQQGGSFSTLAAAFAVGIAWRFESLGHARAAAPWQKRRRAPTETSTPQFS